MSSKLNRSVKAGVAWVMVERGALQVLNLLATVVLARLLSPKDFGVMAVAFMFSGLATRLMQFGFGMGLVQRATIRPDHLSTMFVVTLAINVFLCLLLVAAAPYIGLYFNDPLLEDVLAVMSLSFIIRCVGTCPSALLRRQMNFRASTVGSVLDSAVKIVAGVVLALHGFGVWSLVVGELAGALVKKIYLIAASGWRPGVRVTRAALQDLFGFGIGISLKSTLIYVSEKVDNLVVGKALGTATLGLYERAYNLMDLPVKELSARMNVVLFPAFARIHHDPGRLRAAYRKTVLSLSLICYPIFGSLVILAPEIIEVLYGPKWKATVAPFQILCLAGFPRALTQITSSVINATGLVGPEVRRRVLALLLLAGGSAIGSRWGISGVAAAVTLVNLGTAFVIVMLLVRTCPVAVGDVVRPQMVPLVGVLALLAVEGGTRALLADSWGLPAFWVTATSLAAGSVAYVGMVWLARDDAVTVLVQELWDDARPVLARISPALVYRVR